MLKRQNQKLYRLFLMVYSEQLVDIGLAVGVIVIILLCCVGTIITSLYYNRRQWRPREDSGESLV